MFTITPHNTARQQTSPAHTRERSPPDAKTIRIEYVSHFPAWRNPARINEELSMQLDARHEKARLLMQTGTKAWFGVSRRRRLMRPAPCTPVADGAKREIDGTL